MNETEQQVREILTRRRERQARRVVADQLASYHNALMAHLSEDRSFVRRMAERLDHHLQRQQTGGPDHRH